MRLTSQQQIMRLIARHQITRNLHVRPSTLPHHSLRQPPQPNPAARSPTRQRPLRGKPPTPLGRQCHPIRARIASPGVPLRRRPRQNNTSKNLQSILNKSAINLLDAPTRTNWQALCPPRPPTPWGRGIPPPLVRKVYTSPGCGCGRRRSLVCLCARAAAASCCVFAWWHTMHNVWRLVSWL